MVPLSYIAPVATYLTPHLEKIIWTHSPSSLLAHNAFALAVKVMVWKSEAAVWEFSVSVSQVNVGDNGDVGGMKGEVPKLNKSLNKWWNVSVIN